LERAIELLRKPPLDDLGFVLADLSLDRKRIFTEYSGDISGRMLGVMAFYPDRLFDPDLFLSQVAALQKPDGHFGPDQELPTINSIRDTPLVWGNGRLLIGLVEVYEQTRRPLALEIARKLGDYFVATDSVYRKPENLPLGGKLSEGFQTCYFSCIEGIVGLARVTGDPRYLQQAVRISDMAFSVNTLDDLHSHGRLSALRGVVDLYALTRDRRWLDAVENEWRLFQDRYILASGGVREALSPKWHNDEGCSQADWLRLNVGLWRVTSNGRYLDAAERILKNHFYFNQFGDGGSGNRRFHLVKSEPAGFQMSGFSCYWCCDQHWGRAMIDVQRYAVTPTPDGIRVNLFVNVEIPGRAKVEEIPNGLRVTSSGGTVRVHRPYWAEGTTTSAAVENGEWVMRGASSSAFPTASASNRSLAAARCWPWATTFWPRTPSPRTAGSSRKRSVLCRPSCTAKPVSRLRPLSIPKSRGKSFASRPCARPACRSPAAAGSSSMCAMTDPWRRLRRQSSFFRLCRRAPPPFTSTTNKSRWSKTGKSRSSGSWRPIPKWS
jgi:hypothetical protein